MRNRIQLICVGLFIVLWFGASHAADIKDGFWGTPWQSDLSNTKDFLKIEEKDDLSYYVNPTVVYVINDIKINQVIYGAYKKKFFAVYINIDAFDVFNNMKRYITEKYGSSKMKMKIDPDRTIHSWRHHDAKIKLKLNEETGHMKLGFYYTPISEKVNAVLQKEIQLKSKRFLDVNKERAVETLDLLKF